MMTYDNNVVNKHVFMTTLLSFKTVLSIFLQRRRQGRLPKTRHWFFSPLSVIVTGFRFVAT